MSPVRIILLALAVAAVAVLILGLSGQIGPGWTAGMLVACAAGAIISGWIATGTKPPAFAAPMPVTGAGSTDSTDDSIVFSTALLNGLTDPFLLIDSKRIVVFGNSAAETMFGRSFIGDDITLHLRQPAALAAIDAVHSEGGERTTEVDVPGPVVRTYLLRVTRLPDPRVSTPQRILARHRHTTAISLHDITHIRHAEQMRADFVANVSHELRTPLASLVGFIETLQGPASRDEPARNRFLGIMQREAERMTRLIGDLLSLSRIELDEYNPPSGTVELSGVLKSVREAMQPRAEKRSVTIELDIAEDLPMIVGDRDQLIEVFQNLIDNAIKYGRQNGSVEVTARLVPSAPQIVGPAVTVSVKDDGPGIASEHIPRLTERFYRADSARSRELGGTGLGLAIVKHIINRHQGTLTITSQEGSGSTFSVSVPVPGNRGKPA